MSRSKARILRTNCLQVLEAMAVAKEHPQFKEGELVWVMLPHKIEQAVVIRKIGASPMWGDEYLIRYSVGTAVWRGADLIQKGVRA